MINIPVDPFAAKPVICCQFFRHIRIFIPCHLFRHGDSSFFEDIFIVEQHPAGRTCRQCINLSIRILCIPHGTIFTDVQITVFYFIRQIQNSSRCFELLYLIQCTDIYDICITSCGKHNFQLIIVAVIRDTDNFYADFVLALVIVFGYLFHVVFFITPDVELQIHLSVCGCTVFCCCRITAC